MVNDSSDEASPCDEVENGTLDLPNVSDELNAVAETSVSSPEDVCNRMKKYLTTFEKEHFSPKNVMPDRLCSTYFRITEDLKFEDVLSAITNSGGSLHSVQKSFSICERSSYHLFFTYFLLSFCKFYIASCQRKILFCFIGPTPSNFCWCF